jgi:hypothetical protein
MDVLRRKYALQTLGIKARIKLTYPQDNLGTAWRAHQLVDLLERNGEDHCGLPPPITRHL